MGMKDKKKTNRNKKLLNQTSLKLVEKDKKLGSAKVKKRIRVKESNGDFGKVVEAFVEDNSAKDKKKAKVSRRKKIKNVKNNDASVERNDDREDNMSELEIQRVISEIEGFSRDMVTEISEIASKSRKDKKKRKKSLEKVVESGQDERCSKGISSIFKKVSKKKKRDTDSTKSKKPQKREEKAHLDDVYLISSGDEDSSKGMKKWITEYHQSRPGLKVLQQRIDEFISAHEEKLEQEREEKKARAAEGGWTVVEQRKGRKKTTDAESGITVGSTSQTAVEGMVAKKKHSGVGLDFYRFQKREAQRNEIMMLQSKFEQDKKRIQQLRAARKFRPY